MVYGWAGKILRIDLTKKEITETSTMKYVPQFLGARGINVKIIFDEVKPKVEPFSPENILIIGVGPLVGTGAPASGRTEVTTKSPQTVPLGLLAESSFGGYWGAELKFAGYDNLVIKGRSEKPTYIWIDNENVELKNADHIWGKDTYETQSIIKQDLGDQNIQTICIGEAGEKLVTYANIMHGLGNSAGRTGTGAVMGSKNLKAIVVRGTVGVDLADPDKLLEIYENSYQTFKDLGSEVRLGYSIGVKYLHYETPLGVYGNYEKTVWPPLLNNLDIDGFIKEHALRPHGCHGCPARCSYLFEAPDLGISNFMCISYAGFTGSIWNTDMKLVFESSMLTNKYGIDQYTVYNNLAFLMELYDKEIITEKDTDGIPFEKGSREAILAGIHKMGKREGIGDLLAGGVLRAAKKIRKGAEKYVVHVKGMDQHPYEFRTMHGFALAGVIGVRGEGLRGGPVIEGTGYLSEDRERCFELSKKLFGTEKAIIPWEYDGKAEMVKFYENLKGSADLLGFCKMFVPMSFKDLDLQPLKMPIELFNAATGWNMNEKKLYKIFDRVRTIERMFDVRQGITRNDDKLVRRFFVEPVPDGEGKGRILDEKKFEKMKDEYYKLRGWDEKTGIPTSEKLEELGLQYIVDELKHL